MTVNEARPKMTMEEARDRAAELREQINFHNYRYHVLDSPIIGEPSAPGSPRRSEPRARPERRGPWRLRSQRRCPRG